MSFAALKKQGSLLEKLNSEINKTEVTSGFIDDRLWKPQMGKDGIGSAIIRFLPPGKGNELPWAKVWSHAFQGPGGWYIENSLTTTGGKDPVSDYNRTLWNSGNDADKDTVRKQKRKLSYYSNVYVVKDPLHPENEGRVFLFKYGKKIFDKVLEAMQPEFDDETPINPFDFWQGANFKLKIVKKDGFWNYDKSEFDKVVPLIDDDDALEAIWKKEYSLSAITAPDQFKSYEDLERRLKTVLGQKPVQAPRLDEEVIAEEDPLPVSVAPTSSPSSTSDEDDALSYFQKLADS